MACRPLRWTEGLDVHLDARYLPGQSHVLADSLSRREHVVGTEWSLHPWVGSSPLCVRGNLSIDFCPTILNVILPLSCSLVPDLQTNFEDEFRHPCFDWVFVMRSPFEGRDCFMSQSSIVTKTHLPFTWFRAFAMGSPFSGQVCVGNFRIRSERSLYLNHIPSSFGMGSPFGSGVVLGLHSITNEGFSWKLAGAPSGWGHPVRVKLCTT